MYAAKDFLAEDNNENFYRWKGRSLTHTKYDEWELMDAEFKTKS